MESPLDDSENCELDSLDYQILELLSRDSRIGYTNIAKILNRSHITVKKRIDRLEELKIIQGWTVRLDYEKMGYTIIALIEVSIAKGKLLEVEQIKLIYKIV